MNTIFRHTVFFCFFLVSLAAHSQGRIMVKATVDKNRILIGEHIQLVLQANIPENEPITFFVIDSIPHFEFLDRGIMDTSNTSSGTIIKQTIRVTSFDSGSFVIPSFALAGNEQLRTDSIPVEVGFAPFDTAKGYNDIKDILEVKVQETKDWYWMAAVGAAVLLLVIIAVYVISRRKKPLAAAVPAVNIYESTMKDLSQLQKDNPQVKIFHTRLVDIFRTYIYHRKGIQSLQKTTDDMVVQLKAIDLSKEQYNELAQALRLTDFVKFAKYLPAENDNRNVFETVKRSIEAIERSMERASV